MMKDRIFGRGRVALAAAAVIAGGLFAAATGTAQAAPLAPTAAETVAGDAGTTAVHWRGHRGWHHHHHGWGHRHHGWGHRHHGWGHRHHGWGHRHHGWGHRHHGWGHRHHW
jgi:hypothetical protein